MGKILDTLKRTDPASRKPRETVAPIRAEQVPQPAPAPAQADETVPFIEVGGKGIPAEASAEVLAFGPLPATRMFSLAPVPAKSQGQPLPNKHISGVSLRTVADQHAARSNETPPVSEWLIAFHDPQHQVSRQYRELLQGVREAAGRRSAFALLFVPLARSIGATTALLNVAITAARDRKGEVLVVDGNFAGSGIARHLGMADAPGLKDVLTGRIRWEQVIRPGCVESLFVLPAGKADTSQANQVSTNALAETMRDMGHRFSLILIDGPVWGDDAQVLKFCMGCDSVFAVVPRHKADDWLTSDLVRRLGAAGCRVAGAILTQQ
jgi:Mrp family chromosome partitioning ATPase